VSTHPGELSEPTAGIASTEPLIHTLPPGQRLSRFHSASLDPIFFGKTASNRFDSPDSNYGVLYTGLDEHCAFIETFGQHTGIRFITTTELHIRHLAYLELTQPVTLIDLARSGGLARIGADARLLAGSHSVSQKWSAALRAHPAGAHGILYPTRHDPARLACALFDLPTSVFKVTKAGSLLESRNAKLLGELLDTYGFGLMSV
jgi:hypothetical protein